MPNDYNILIKKLYNNEKNYSCYRYAREPHKLMESNPEVYEAIRQKEMKNAFKLKPMPSYKPNINYNGK